MPIQSSGDISLLDIHTELSRDEVSQIYEGITNLFSLPSLHEGMVDTSTAIYACMMAINPDTGYPYGDTDQSGSFTMSDAIDFLRATTRLEFTDGVRAALAAVYNDPAALAECAAFGDTPEVTTADTVLNLNNLGIRSLLGKPSGAISLSDAYGKSADDLDLLQTWEFLWEVPGTYSITVPEGIDSFTILAVSGGGAGASSTSSSNGFSGAGGGGGALLYINGHDVRAGDTWYFTIGSGGAASSGSGTSSGQQDGQPVYLLHYSSSIHSSPRKTIPGGSKGYYNNSPYTGAGGIGAVTDSHISLGEYDTAGLYSSGIVSIGGGNGGTGGRGQSGHQGGGGGGAGGYSGNGGNGGNGSSNGATCGTGGAGGGSNGDNSNTSWTRGNGGGVGIYGEGISGCPAGNAGGFGGAGSNGVNGYGNNSGQDGAAQNGWYGGGGGGSEDDSGFAGHFGGKAVIRVLLNPTGESLREFPSTDVEISDNVNAIFDPNARKAAPPPPPPPGSSITGRVLLVYRPGSSGYRADWQLMSMNLTQGGVEKYNIDFGVGSPSVAGWSGYATNSPQYGPNGFSASLAWASHADWLSDPNTFWDITSNTNTGTWGWHSGSTPSSSTGVGDPHGYIYAETSSGSRCEWVLLSPEITVNVGETIDFTAEIGCFGYQLDLGPCTFNWVTDNESVNIGSSSANSSSYVQTKNFTFTTTQ